MVICTTIGLRWLIKSTHTNQTTYPWDHSSHVSFTPQVRTNQSDISGSIDIHWTHQPCILMIKMVVVWTNKDVLMLVEWESTSSIGGMV